MANLLQVAFLSVSFKVVAARGTSKIWVEGKHFHKIKSLVIHIASYHDYHDLA